MATLQRPSLPSGQLKGSTATRTDRGSFAWVRRIAEKFKSSGRTQTQTIQYFGSETVDLSNQSAKDKVYNILNTDIFFGMRDAVPVPREAQAVFDERIVHRLKKDLDQAWKAIQPKSTSRLRNTRTPNQFISELVELRMSGRAAGGRNGRVELVPTIWVRCTAWQRAGMEEALDATCMKWAHETEFGRIMVGDTAKLLSSDASSSYEIPVGRGVPLDQHRLDGITLHLEIEDVATRTSVEGMLCRATLMKGGVVRSQKLSTIGGILDVGGRPFGLTSAHGILGNLWDALCMEGYILPGADSIADETFGFDRNAPPESNNISSGGSSDEDDFSCYAEFAMKPPHPPPAPPRKWIEVEIGDVANFLSLKAIAVKGEDGVPSTVLLINDGLKSDFALVRLDSISNHMGKDAPTNTLSTSVIGYEASEIIAPGPVSIHLRNMEVEGIVLENPASLDIFGVSMSTQYIQLPQPLPLGSSGAWAVRDNILCGMIIAGYDDEPYAHMIAASRFVADIKNSIPNTPSITAFKGSLAKYFSENKMCATISASTSHQKSLPSQATPSSSRTTPGTTAPFQVTAPLPPPPAVQLSPRSNNINNIFELIRPRSHPVAKRTNRVSLQLAKTSVQPRNFIIYRNSTRNPVRTSSPVHETIYDSRHDPDDEHEESRYIPNASSLDPTGAHIYKDLDTQKFNRPVAFLAALEYLASWYSLFAVNLAASSLDFVYSNPESAAENDVLGSGVLPVLLGMSAGMFASGLFATFHGNLKISSAFLVVLLVGIIGMLASISQRNVSLILFWEVIMGLGIGSSSLLPAIAIVECSSAKTRLAMLALVLSMQGLAQLYVHGLGALILSMYLRRHPERSIDTDKLAVNQTWRIVLGLGALPIVAALLLRLCTDVPESPRYLLITRNSPQLAEKAVMSLKHSSTRRLFFGWRGLAFSTNFSKGTSTSGNTKWQSTHQWFRGIYRYLITNTTGDTNRQSISQWARGLWRYLFRSYTQSYRVFHRRDGYFRLLAWSTASWLLLSVAFFGMGLDNPQEISSAWGVMSPGSILNGARARYYTQASNGNDLLQSWIVVLQFLSGPAVLGYLVRIYMVRYFSRRTILHAASLLALIPLAVFGSVLYLRQRSEQPETKEDNGDGVLVLIMYSLFQFAMSLAPSALQFAFAAEIIDTRYRAALLGTCSAVAMLGAAGVRALVIYVDVFKGRLNILPFLCAAAMAGSILVSAIFLPRNETATEVRVLGTRRLATRPLEQVTGETELIHGDSEFEMNELR